MLVDGHRSCWSRSLAALLIVVFGWGASRATATPTLLLSRVKLVMRATGAPVDYIVRTAETQTREGPSRPKATHASEIQEVVSQEVCPAGDALVVTVHRKAKMLLVNGKVVSNQADPGTYSYRIDARGARLAPAGDDPAAALWPVLPDEAIGPGHRWHVAVPATRTFGLPIQGTHLFERFALVQGVRCAVIVSEARAGGVDRGTGAKVQASLTGVLFLSVSDGIVIRSDSSVELELVYPTPAVSGVGKLHRKVDRTILRQPRPALSGNSPGAR